MGKGSGRRKENTKLIEQNWDRIFGAKPNDKQFEGIKYGNKPNTKNIKKIKR